MILSFMIYDSFFFSDLWFFLSLSLSQCVCVCMCIYFLFSFFSDLWFFLLFWSMILWNLNGSNLIGSDRSFKFKCHFFCLKPSRFGFYFLIFLVWLLRKWGRRVHFLVWNPVENEATGDLKLWVLAVQEKKGKRKKEKNFKPWLTPFVWNVKLDRCQNFK